MSVNNTKDKQIVVYTHNRISHTVVKIKELQITQNNMDESQEHNIQHKSGL